MTLEKILSLMLQYGLNSLTKYKIDIVTVVVSLLFRGEDTYRDMSSETSVFSRYISLRHPLKVFQL